MTARDHRFRDVARAEARLQRIKTHWEMRGPDGRILVCGMYRDTGGYELRVWYQGNEPEMLYSSRLDVLDTRDATDPLVQAVTLILGRTLAEHLRAEMLATEGFEEIAISDSEVH